MSSITRLAFIIFIFLMPCISLHAGNENDSLLNVLANTGQDTNRVIILNKLAHNPGRGKFNECIAYAREALQLSEKLGYKRGIQKTLNIMGSMYEDTGDYTTALDLFLKSLRLAEEMSDTTSIAAAYNNIGINYFKLRNYPKALDNHNLSIKIKEKTNNRKGLAISYNNIGNVYTKMEDFEKALDYYGKSLVIREELNDKRGTAYALNNMGNVFRDRGEHAKALDHYERSLKIKRELGDLKGISLCLMNMGEVYLMKKDPAKALTYLQEGYAIAEKIQSYDALEEVAGGLARAYKMLGNYREAMRYFEETMSLKDTLYNRENLSELAQMQTLYETEKKEKAIVLLEKDKEVQAVEIRKQQVYIYFFSLGGLLVAICSFVLFNAYRNKKRLSDLLSRQKKEIQHQKELVEEKNREITDSINYAHRIQTALLPSAETMRSVFPESFVLLKPKDIVSGDFYWLTEKDGYSFYVTADCTGHGVPGGFMSMLGTSFLNEIVNEKGITEPAQVLNELRDHVIKALKQKGAAGESKDGMDMTLCRIDRSRMELVYSAANNPLYIVRDETLLQHQPDKQPIGYYTEQMPFTQHTVKLLRDDMIYTFSDGYADQFGGPKGKKFKYKQLQQVLLSVHKLPVKEQHSLLDDTIGKWRGNLEQVDDILVVGVRV